MDSLTLNLGTRAGYRPTQDVPGCPKCPRRAGCTQDRHGVPIRLIEPTGPAPARVMVIGDGPGLDDLRRRVVFGGRVGRELDQTYLPLAGLHRHELYTTYAVKCGTPDGEAPEPDVARSCAEWWLQDELDRVRPAVVIVAGTIAARAVLGPGVDLGDRFDPDTHHGQLYGRLDYQLVDGAPGGFAWGYRKPAVFGIPSPTAPFIVHATSPAAAMIGGDMMTRALGDWESVGRVMASIAAGRYPHRVDSHPFTVYREITTPAQVAAALAPADSATRGRWVAVDTETDGKGGPPWCLSFSTRPGTGWVVPADAVEALGVFAVLMDPRLDPWRWVLLHNALFDLDVLTAMDVTGFHWRDTMHRAYQLGDQPQGLKPLAWRTTGMEMQDYSDVVRGPSVPAVVRWMERVSRTVAGALPAKQPRRKLVMTPEMKAWKKHTGLLGRRAHKLSRWSGVLYTPTPLPYGHIKRYLGLPGKGEGSGLLFGKLAGVYDWTDPATKDELAAQEAEDVTGQFPDPWKWWDEREPAVRGMLSMFGAGPMPAESIVHVPRGRAVQYAARDADATLRAHFALRGEMRRLAQVVPAGGHLPYPGYGTAGK